MPRAHVRHLYPQPTDPAKLCAGIVAYPAVVERLNGNDLTAAATPVRQTGAKVRPRVGLVFSGVVAPAETSGHHASAFTADPLAPSWLFGLNLFSEGSWPKKKDNA